MVARIEPGPFLALRDVGLHQPQHHTLDAQRRIVRRLGDDTDMPAGHGAREYIAPFSALQWLLWLVCWLLTGTYAIASWRRGGQTLGMRPWRLRVAGIDGAPATLSALRIRYAVGTLSVLAAGLGFWWAWLDRDGLTWHDRASGTRLVRLPKA